MKALRGLFIVPLAMLLAASIGGCSKTAQPDGPTVAANSGSNRKDSMGSEQNRSQSQGSLEDLRRGQPPVTPANSPLKEIYFDFDSYTLRADARESLKGDAEWLKRNPG